MEYADFLKRKAIVDPPTGLAEVPHLHASLFPFQHDIVSWALRRGRAAIFADCGLGKTFMQLEWAQHIPGRVLILAPLAVAQQTVREGTKFGVPATYARSQEEADAGERITVTNYEMLQHFDASVYQGVVLDESSILKAFDGKTRTELIETFHNTPFRLACTATPAPNDYMELGNHSEFLGIMSRTEMLATFFVHDGGDTSSWRLKGHGQDAFWKWLASWAVMLRKPSDLHYSDEGFDLPPLRILQETVKTEAQGTGHLFPVEAQSLQERLEARRNTVDARVDACAALVNASTEPWVVWCNLNTESEALTKAIPDAVEIRGSHSPAEKEAALAGFADGSIRVLVTKPSIAGFGLNWQHCANVAFVGLSDSYEQFYQATRRCWRFGQTRPVDVHLIVADVEGAVVANIERKERDAQNLANNLVKHMSDLSTSAIKSGSTREKDAYARGVENGEGWTMHLGDCVDVLREMPEESAGFSVFSPPFASLYTYSNSDRDMGNVRNDEEFFDQLQYMIEELFRVMKTGRLVSFHCMDLPMSKVRDGVIGLRDFRGDLIRAFEKAGFVFHSSVTIWKDPVTAMQRTKALGLLYKQLRKDSAMSRQGIPDYLVTMRKPGVNAEPVFHKPEEFTVGLWQKYASPVWMDIDPSDTLQFRTARENNDERHICPLQLEVIRRATYLWSNPGDIVLSPFAGIGSEGVVALEAGRKFVGIELKKSYFDLAVKNLSSVERVQPTLFAEVHAAATA